MALPNHPPDGSTDEAHAECARVNHCQGCFQELARRFQVPLLHFLLRRIGARQDAEDLLQETFLLAYRKLHRYRSTWRFSTWIFTIANRLAVSHWRKRRPTSGAGGLGRHPDNFDPLASIQDQEERGALWDVVRQILEPEAFTALWLNYVESMSAEEIGKVIGRSPNAIRVLLHRARARIAGPLARFDLSRSRHA